MMRRAQRPTSEREAGQVLVEFAMAISVFILLVMGVVDLGRLVYQYNGVSEAARELARTTSVHPGSVLGADAETTGVYLTQRGMVPGLAAPTYACVDIAGATVTGVCTAGNWVRVTIHSTFIPATPLATVLGTIVLTSSANARIE
jgi:Flp pilus assembly protein TadG